MDNLARKEYLDREIAPFMREIATLSDLKTLREVCHDFLYLFPPQRGLEVASALTFANPFFIADIPAEYADKLAINLELLSEMVMRAKLTASRSSQRNVLVASAPHALPAALQDALRLTFALPSASLYTAAFNGASASALGGDLGEQELDELSLIRNGLNQRGYVAQQHIRCTPYAARLLGTYNVRPIVAYRNIFSTITAAEAALTAGRSSEMSAERQYFADGLPAGFARLDRADRLMLLAQRLTPWLVQFYVSWKKCERMGIVNPLWISYEQDFLGDAAGLAKRIVDHVGFDGSTVIRLANTFRDKLVAANAVQFAQVATAGELPEAVRAFILSATRYYSEDEDLTPLIGE